MKRIHEIIEEVKSLRGANVRVFGQPTTLPSDYGKYTIDIIDVLNHLEDYEIPEIVDYWDFEEDEDGEEEEVLHEISAEEYLELLDSQGFLVEEETSNNTYNWSAPISNNFYYHVYKNLRDDNLIIEIAVHRYGDVRGNYTDEFYIIVDSIDEFYDILTECNIFNTVEVDGKKYYVDTRIFSDVFEVCDTDGECIGTIYAENDEEAIREIKELLSEE